MTAGASLARGLDPSFLFGDPPDFHAFTPEELALVDDHETTWVKFMRTGKPKGPFPRWPPLDASRPYMAIDLTPALQRGGSHPASCDVIAPPMGPCEDCQRYCYHAAFATVRRREAAAHVTCRAPRPPSAQRDRRRRPSLPRPHRPAAG